ncbi:hypothetical protein C8R44DRAFT_733026 [Mycena epipterygia]|nr:hypothetical protein C8R44DRAFT_733026 [Mycena epipterygia]
MEVVGECGRLADDLGSQLDPGRVACGYRSVRTEKQAHTPESFPPIDFPALRKISLMGDPFALDAVLACLSLPASLRTLVLASRPFLVLGSIDDAMLARIDTRLAALHLPELTCLTLVAISPFVPAADLVAAISPDVVDVIKAAFVRMSKCGELSVHEFSVGYFLEVKVFWGRSKSELIAWYYKEENLRDLIVGAMAVRVGLARGKSHLTRSGMAPLTQRILQRREVEGAVRKKGIEPSVPKEEPLEGERVERQAVKKICCKTQRGKVAGPGSDAPESEVLHAGEAHAYEECQHVDVNRYTHAADKGPEIARGIFRPEICLMVVKEINDMSPKLRDSKYDGTRVAVVHVHTTSTARQNKVN